MPPMVHFHGAPRYWLRSAASLCRSVIGTSFRRAVKGPRRPGCNWSFEFETEIFKAQLGIAFDMRDVFEARRFLDSLVIRPPASEITITSFSNDQFRGHWFIPRRTEPRATILYFHGGGYSFYPRNYARLISQIALAANSSTFALDYRLAPEYRFPAQLEDALNAYRWLVENDTKPENLVVAGDSAGGNLTLSLLLALRSAKLPFPSLAIALSPPTDFDAPLPQSSPDTYDWIDARMLEQWSDWFCDPIDRQNPLISPARASLRGLPPIYIQAGRAELLYGSILAFADRALDQRADVFLESWEHMNHDFQMFAPDVPQSVEALRRIGEVVELHTQNHEEHAEALSTVEL